MRLQCIKSRGLVFTHDRTLRNTLSILQIHYHQDLVARKAEFTSTHIHLPLRRYQSKRKGVVGITVKYELSRCKSIRSTALSSLI